MEIQRIDPLDDQAIQLIVPGDGTVQIPHLGLKAHAAALTSEDLTMLDGLVEREPETVTAADAIGLIATINAEAYEEPDWHYCVRIFADCQVDQRDGTTVSFSYGDNPAVPNRNTSRGPELLAYLALSPGRSATFSEIREHLWWGKAVSDRTVHPLITGTRRVLGGTAYLSHAEGHPSPRRYDLGRTIRTDVELLAHAYTFARSAAMKSPDIALAVIEPHLARLEAPAFREGRPGGGLVEWAAANRIFDEIELPVINAALLVDGIHEQRGAQGHPDALRALDQALRVCPTNEALIRAAMEREANLGNREGALRRYDALASQLGRDELEPEPDTTALIKRIRTTDPRIG